MRRSEKGGGRRRKNAEHLNFYYSLLLQQNALNLDMQKQINNNNSIRMYLYT